MNQNEWIKDVEEAAAAQKAKGAKVESSEGGQWIAVTLADGIKKQDGVVVGLINPKEYYFQGEETNEYFDQSNDIESNAAYVNFNDWMLWQAVGWG